MKRKYMIPTLLICYITPDGKTEEQINHELEDWKVKIQEAAMECKPDPETCDGIDLWFDEGMPDVRVVNVYESCTSTADAFTVEEWAEIRAKRTGRFQFDDSEYAPHFDAKWRPGFAEIETIKCEAAGCEYRWRPGVPGSLEYNPLGEKTERADQPGVFFQYGVDPAQWVKVTAISPEGQTCLKGTDYIFDGSEF